MADAGRLMTVFEAISKRHAVRAYRPDRLAESTVRELMKQAVKAPTAMHAEPWAFAVIQAGRDAGNCVALRVRRLHASEP